MIISREVKCMERYHLAKMVDFTEISYSGIKVRMNGEEYITMCFERLGKNNCARIYAEYPGRGFYDIEGYSQDDIDVLSYHYNKLAPLAYQIAKEDGAYA